MMKNKPGWYTEEHDSNWNRVKAAFRKDWEQTKHDFGSDSARDLNQNVDDTVKQAAGKEETFESREDAFRFGHAAQRQFRTQYPTWNNELDTRLRQDYGDRYDRDRSDIRRAYEYRYASAGGDLGSGTDRPADRR